jgi:hypothetical protein
MVIIGWFGNELVQKTLVWKGMGLKTGEERNGCNRLLWNGMSLIECGVERNGCNRLVWKGIGVIDRGVKRNGFKDW